MTALPSFYGSYGALVEAELLRLIPPADHPVSDAMAYTLMAPSKRLRPVVTLLSAELFGIPPARALPSAAAVEMVHASSLILDDLPSMDDAPLRRGRAANHVQFGEGIAILAAFALLNRAYTVVAESYEPELAVKLQSLLGDAVGTRGLIGGQAADLRGMRHPATVGSLERIHRRKTGALFAAAAKAGATVAGAPADGIAALAEYAMKLGLAFQIIDDLLDEEGESVRTTFVSIMGVEGARELALELCRNAEEALDPFGERAGKLKELAAFVPVRSA
jgi:geranylgeranyl pyrophosphate synthase